MIDRLKLLAGDSIEVDGIIIKQPKLRDIKNIGIDAYYWCLCFLTITMEQYLTSTKRQDSIPDFKEQGITMFDIYLNSIPERDWFIGSLSFFIDGKIEYYGDRFLVNNHREITKINYPKIAIAIGEINFIKINYEQQQELYANEKARQIAEKIRQAREKQKALTKKEDVVLLDDIISSVAARHPSLNLLNIWDLTVYQLYDQYHRLRTIDDYNIQAMNLAYRGGEKDFEHYSVPLKLLIK